MACKYNGKNLKGISQFPGCVTRQLPSGLKSWKPFFVLWTPLIAPIHGTLYTPRAPIIRGGVSPSSTGFPARGGHQKRLSSPIKQQKLVSRHLKGKNKISQSFLLFCFVLLHTRKYNINFCCLQCLFCLLSNSWLLRKSMVALFY